MQKVGCSEGRPPTHLEEDSSENCGNAAPVWCAHALHDGDSGAVRSSRLGAAAGTTVACPGTSSTAFAQWGDQDQYVLAPNGDFEAPNFASTSGWTLTGGAAQVAGNESYSVHAKTDAHSLSLPAGATATTPAICVNVYDPTIRLFATGTGGSSLKVEVIATLSNGMVVTLPLAKLATGSTWAPTPAIYFFANLLALRSANGTANVQFRFTAVAAPASRSTISSSTRAKGTNPRPSPRWRRRPLRPRRLHLSRVTGRLLNRGSACV